MACNLLSRWFRRRTSRLPVSANTTSPPALPVHTDSTNQLEQSLKQLDLSDQTRDDIFSLACLPGEGSYILSLPDIPFGANNSSLQTLRDLPGFIGFESGVSDNPAASTDVFLHFSTAAEAAHAMASNLTLNVDNGGVRRLQPDNRVSESDERAAKRQKIQLLDPPPKCLVCCEELPGPHVRPCLHCDRRWCYDCLKTNFSVALNDSERFPSQCCGRVIHYDVARGLLSQNDHARYRTRFEEHSTTKPVYCANPVCSAFLPPRLAKADERGRVRCFSCESVTCNVCREVVSPEAADTHACTAADQITALVKQFDYKRCPRCNTGVARMFGCSHIRCQCGAHWCWDCERAIHICWSKPCDRAREDGDMTDENDFPADESDSDDDATIAGSNEDLAQSVAQPQGLDSEVLDSGDAPTQSDPVEEVSGAQSSTNHIQEERSILVNLEIGEATITPNRVDSGSLDEFRDNENMLAAQGDVVDEHTATLAANTLDHPVAAMAAVDALNTAARDTTDADSVPLVHNTASVDGATSVEVAPTEYRPPAVHSTTPELPPTQVSYEVNEPLINLDAEDHDDWQNGEYDFGDEPLDETWDTWGCLHRFIPLHNNKMHHYWLPKRRNDGAKAQTVKELDCLRCYKTIILKEQTAEEKAETDRKDSGVELPSSDVQQVSEAPTTDDVAASNTEPQKYSKKKGKNKKDTQVPKLFNCNQCGVVYCNSCKKTTVKELIALRDSNMVRD